MAWSRLQSASGTVASGNPAATFGTNLSAGTKIIALVTLSTSQGTNVGLSAVVTCSDGTNPLTFLGGIVQGTLAYTGVFAMDTPAGDVGAKPTITATVSASVNNFGCTILIQEVSGLATGNTTAMLDGTVATNDATSTGPATTGAYTSTAASEYLIACYGDPGNGVTVATPAGYTADLNNTASGSVAGISNSNTCIFYKNSGAAAEAASMTLGGSSNWNTLLVALKLPSGIAVSGTDVSAAGSDTVTSVGVCDVRGYR